MDDRGIGVRFEGEVREFSPLYSVQTGSGAESASYPKVLRCPFFREKSK
jgi:hypothetical protein